MEIGEITVKIADMEEFTDMVNIVEELSGAKTWNDLGECIFCGNSYHYNEVADRHELDHKVYCLVKRARNAIEKFGDK